jgi:hypothetical protein
MGPRAVSILCKGLPAALAAVLFTAQLLLVLHEGTHDLLGGDADHCDVCFVATALHQAATAMPPALPPPPAAAFAPIPAPAARAAHALVDPHPKRGPPLPLDA